MNRFHRRYCASRTWAARVEESLLPWGLDGVDLGPDVLEVGPGLGVTTRLRPGGVFAGTDSRPSWRFRVIHLFDTMTCVDPATLGGRLETAGFTDVQVADAPGRVRFRARKPETRP